MTSNDVNKNDAFFYIVLNTSSANAIKLVEHVLHCNKNNHTPKKKRRLLLLLFGCAGFKPYYYNDRKMTINATINSLF